MNPEQPCEYLVTPIAFLIFIIAAPTTLTLEHSVR